MNGSPIQERARPGVASKAGHHEVPADIQVVRDTLTSIARAEDAVGSSGADA